MSFTESGGVRWDLVIAHESHNHPSQVLPVEGAATGIGGIVRDVYCMGAEVIGVMDPLRFGTSIHVLPPARDRARGRTRASGSTATLWACRTWAGTRSSTRATNDNCLVNVVAVGLVRHDRIVRSRVPAAARNEPYVLILVGKPTDATGFGGATFASADLDSAGRHGSGAGARPVPEAGRLRGERAVLEMLFERGIEFGFKDLGAGGIACVSSEMASHGGMGIELWLDRVPVSAADLPAGGHRLRGDPGAVRAGCAAGCRIRRRGDLQRGIRAADGCTPVRAPR